MNLKKTVLSSLAVVALSLSMASPIAFAAEGNSVDGKVGVNEVGTFNFNLWGNQAPNFGTVDLDTTTGDQVLPTKSQQVDYHETRTSSPGWTIQLTATDFEANDESGHSIPASYLTVGAGSPYAGAWFSCLKSSAVENTDNPFARPTVPTAQANLAGAVSILDADEGRGCGHFFQKLTWGMTVPQGTYTGGDATTFVSDITISTMAEAGEP
jgi:hypothetical protein